MQKYKAVKVILLVGVVLTVILGGATTASASLTGGPDIIPAPISVANDASQNENQQAFDEAQGVLLTAALDVDGGTIPAGTTVNSHMIFLDPVSHSSITDSNVVWTFDGAILGVMSDALGELEEDSNSILGASGTSYPGGSSARGMEGGDSYTVDGNQITVTMTASEPGDWIRVITLAETVTDIEVDIDIKPGSEPNPINLKSKGVIPVAILTTESFDASTVNITSVVFGPNEASPVHYAMDDVDDDGDLDMILHFSTQEVGLTTDDIEATLIGETIDGISIHGTDSVRIVPSESKGNPQGKAKGKVDAPGQNKLPGDRAIGKAKGKASAPGQYK